MDKIEIHIVCAGCGVTANYLTCLKKYGKPPIKKCFTVSTYHQGKCDYCCEETSVTEVRDFFYPDFSLIEKVKELLNNKRMENDKLNNPLEGQVETYPEHDCHAWNTKVYGGSKNYTYTECGVCHRITDFLHKSYWQRIKNVFRGKFSN